MLKNFEKFHLTCLFEQNVLFWIFFFTLSNFFEHCSNFLSLFSLDLFFSIETMSSSAISNSLASLSKAASNSTSTASETVKTVLTVEQKIHRLTWGVGILYGLFFVLSIYILYKNGFFKSIMDVSTSKKSDGKDTKKEESNSSSNSNSNSNTSAKTAK